MDPQLQVPTLWFSAGMSGRHVTGLCAATSFMWHVGWPLSHFS